MEWADGWKRIREHSLTSLTQTLHLIYSSNFHLSLFSFSNTQPVPVLVIHFLILVLHFRVPFCI